MTNVTRWTIRRAAVAVGVAALVVPAMLTAQIVTATSVGAKAGTLNERYPVPPGGVFTLHGRGFGHGHGMSQWGAYGAAKVGGLSANQILNFYYPHTTLATKPTTKLVRVLLTAVEAPATGYVEVAPAAGLTATPDGGAAQLLSTSSPATKKAPKGEPITMWRLQQGSSSLALRAQWSGAWHTVTKKIGTSVAFSDTAAEVAIAEPNGSSTKTIRYRGAVSAQIHSGDVECVNVIPIELYIDSVVPSEMPSSWSAAALQAQAVAARTYTYRGIENPKASWFDLFGDTRDQGYGGVGSETTRTDNAIHSTAGEVIVDSTGAPILAQYASADGGWTVSGGVSYLPAKADPYDGAIPNDAHAWTTTLSASAIAAAFPSVGKVKDLVITGRDGNGKWGGRVTTMSIIGSKSTETVSGTDFQDAFGLRSPWFRPTPTPGPPLSVTAKATGHSVTIKWRPPAAISGAAPVTGYRVKLAPGGRAVNVVSSATSATLTKVAPGSYSVTVVARSDAGAGPAGAASSPVVVKAGH